MPILRVLLAALLGGAGGSQPTAFPRQLEPRNESRLEAARLLAQVLAGEPRVEAVQRAAEARAGPSREETEGWRRRSRLSALMPRVTTEYRHDERSLHMVGVSSGSEVDYLRSSPGDTFSVRLDFDLDGVVFGKQELAAATAAERAEAVRRQAVERATKLYFERLRLRLSLAASPPESPRDRVAQEIQLEAVTAELDALTGLYAEGSP